MLQDVKDLQRRVAVSEKELDVQGRALGSYEEQINGRRGMQAAINDLTLEVRSLRKAAYWVAGILIASSIGFAFGVLALVPG